MKSDYDKWFIGPDGTAFKCMREKLIDALVDLVGRARASQIHSQYRKATFSESCRLELEYMEDRS